MNLGGNSQVQKLSPIFISLDQIKSLRPSGPGKARCLRVVIIGPSVQSGVEMDTEN